MTVEDRIKRWQEQEPGEEDEDEIELLCDAEAELRTLRGVVLDLLEWASGYESLHNTSLARVVAAARKAVHGGDDA